MGKHPAELVLRICFSEAETLSDLSDSDLRSEQDVYEFGLNMLGVRCYIFSVLCVRVNDMDVALLCTCIAIRKCNRSQLI